MDTLKTGFIVVLLLAVLYGVYVVLNKDQTPPSAEIAWHQQQAENDLQIDIGMPTDPAAATGSPGKSGGQPGTSSPAINQGSRRAAELGIPSVITAELSPLSEVPKLKDVPAKSAPRIDSSLNQDVPGLSAEVTPVSQESPVTAPVPTPSPLPAAPTPLPETSRTKDGVAAPSLLPNLSSTAPPTTPPAAIADTGTPLRPSAAAPTRSNDLSSLPSLREPREPSTWPSQTPATPPAPARPAIKVPDRIPDRGAETPPTATSPADKLDAASSVGTNPSAGEASSEPSTPTPEVTAGALDAKSVTTAAAFDAAMREAQTNLGDEQWYQALFVLSKLYDSPDLASEQREKLLDLLDPLAAKVVYSQEHLVADAHEVRRGETLAQIAASHQVPQELIANINGLENPDLLIPGTNLKMVRGPFRAHIDLQSKELTLFAGHLYAGRFPISVGSDPEPTPGEYRVLEKQPGRDYFSSAGQRITANDPQNPFGRVWIGLDKELCIHGSPERGDAGGMGCISLSPLDAVDVYGILTAGSSVTVRR